MVVNSGQMKKKQTYSPASTYWLQGVAYYYNRLFDLMGICSHMLALLFGIVMIMFLTYMMFIEIIFRAS